MSRHKRILSYWSSIEGEERINDYRSRLLLELDFFDHVKAGNKYFCFGCFKEKESFKGLEICHIIPKSIGGSNLPKNLVLLCHECHLDNPNTPYEDEYFQWLDSVEFYLTKRYKNIEKSIKTFKLDKELIDEIYEDKGERFFLEMACDAMNDCIFHQRINENSFIASLSHRIRKQIKNEASKQMELFK